MYFMEYYGVLLCLAIRRGDVPSDVARGRLGEEEAGSRGSSARERGEREDPPAAHPHRIIITWRGHRANVIRTHSRALARTQARPARAAPAGVCTI